MRKIQLTEQDFYNLITDATLRILKEANYDELTDADFEDVTDDGTPVLNAVYDDDGQNDYNRAKDYFNQKYQGFKGNFENVGDKFYQQYQDYKDGAKQKVKDNWNVTTGTTKNFMTNPNKIGYGKLENAPSRTAGLGTWMMNKLTKGKYGEYKNKKANTNIQFIFKQAASKLKKGASRDALDYRELAPYVIKIFNYWCQQTTGTFKAPEEFYNGEWINQTHSNHRGSVKQPNGTIIPTLTTYDENGKPILMTTDGYLLQQDKNYDPSNKTAGYYCYINNDTNTTALTVAKDAQYRTPQDNYVMRQFKHIDLEEQDRKQFGGTKAVNMWHDYFNSITQTNVFTTRGLDKYIYDEVNKMVKEDSEPPQYPLRGLSYQGFVNGQNGNNKALSIMR